MCAITHTTAHLWRAKDKSQESVFSFSHSAPVQIKLGHLWPCSSGPIQFGLWCWLEGLGDSQGASHWSSIYIGIPKELDSDISEDDGGGSKVDALTNKRQRQAGRHTAFPLPSLYLDCCWRCRQHYGIVSSSWLISPGKALRNQRCVSRLIPDPVKLTGKINHCMWKPFSEKELRETLLERMCPKETHSFIHLRWTR